jgi:hypothetical protein
MKERFIYLFSLCFLFGCTGYHFNNATNPLIGYDIRSVSVPMFVNQSVMPQMAGLMTKEIVLSLKDFSGLKVINGDQSDSDAVLLGIVESGNHYSEVIQTTSTAYTNTDTNKNIKKSIGNRQDFYYPATTAYTMQLRVILIKRPTKDEIDFLQKNTLGLAKYHPKVVLTEILPITGSFTRVVYDNLTPNSGGEVNFVKNKGILEKSLQDSCLQTAKNFKQVVLNAF